MNSLVHLSDAFIDAVCVDIDGMLAEARQVIEQGYRDAVPEGTMIYWEGDDLVIDLDEETTASEFGVGGGGARPMIRSAILTATPAIQRAAQEVFTDA